jgi:RNA polymerase sigma-70 factor (ECF subfamily)
MKTAPGPDTDHLLESVRQGDPAAREHVLARHRDRLRKMVAFHMDRRLSTRFDPSDVVQEALAEADRRLDEYVRRPPLPFYPWLRQIAWDRLIELRRRHSRAAKRTVSREEPDFFDLPDDSAVLLAGRLCDLGSSPSQHVLRVELRAQVQAALALLPARQREILVLRHLEQLSTSEIASVLGIGVRAVKSRHLRALQRLRGLLGPDFAKEDS